MFNIELTNNSKGFLKRCDGKLLERLKKKMRDLQNEPFPSDCKRVVGRPEKTFRVRVGDYRILYSLLAEQSVIIIQDIDKRANVYD